MEVGLAKRVYRPKGRAQPGYEGRREIAPAIVESPYVKGDYEPVIRNVRESSLTAMHARGQIDDAQLRAGEWFRATYERTRMGSMAIDPSKEPVDTSGHSDPIPDRLIRASEDLAAAAGELGKVGYPVVENVCGQGCSVEQASQRYFGRQTTKNEVRAVGVLLRASLDVLAVWRGYATNPKR